MIHSCDPFGRPPERVWLHRAQWRTVAALLLLLAAVVASLAMASGYWWAIHSLPVRVARAAAPAPPTPVATVTIPAVSASVVELVPLTIVHPRGQEVVVRSPGGAVAGLLVRKGQRVSAGQVLARLEQPALPAQFARAPAPVVSEESIARQRDEAERLRQRLERVRSEIRQLAASEPAEREPVRASGPADRPSGSREAGRALDAEARAAASVEQARRKLAAATDTRRTVDRQYEERRSSRFLFHLAHSREILAQVELRRAEEEAEAARQAAAAAAGPAVAAAAPDEAAARDWNRRRGRLEREARALETRLARAQVRVAGTRQRLGSPPPEMEVRPARAPQSGTVTAVWAKAGARMEPGAPLASIELPERPRLRARVARWTLPAMPPGALVTLQDGAGRPFTGRVTGLVRAPDGASVVELLPSRGARVDRGAFLVPPSPRALPPTLPAAALIQGPRGSAVWLAVRFQARPGHWAARRQPVRAAAAGRNRVAILAGLRPGSRVIVAGPRRLREGQPVAPVEVGALAAG